MNIYAYDISEDIWLLYKRTDNNLEIYKDLLFTSLQSLELFIEYANISEDWYGITLEEYIDKVKGLNK